MIAPVVLASAFYLSRAEGTNGVKTKVTVPLFAVAFLINTLLCAALDASSFTFLGIGWNLVKTALTTSLLPFLLAISFAGVGTKVQFRDIASVGWKPFAFAAAMAVIAGTLALAMAVATAPYLS